MAEAVAPSDAGVARPPAPEVEIAGDLARRAVPLAGLLAVASALVWGLDGLASSAFAAGLVVLNFAAAAGIMAWAARISLAVLMGAVLAGYVVRLGVITVAVLLVQDAGWVERVPLFATLLVTHVGLLVWEARYVSASLAYPGIAPGGRFGLWLAPSGAPGDVPSREAEPS